MSTTTSPRTYTAAIETGRVEDLPADELAEALKAAGRQITVLAQRAGRKHVDRAWSINTTASGCLTFSFDYITRTSRAGFKAVCVTPHSAGAHHDVVFDLYNLGRLVRLAPATRNG